jgi:hypothetical protein
MSTGTRWDGWEKEIAASPPSDGAAASPAAEGPENATKYQPLANPESHQSEKLFRLGFKVILKSGMDGRLLGFAKGWKLMAELGFP